MHSSPVAGAGAPLFFSQTSCDGGPAQESLPQDSLSAHRPDLSHRSVQAVSPAPAACTDSQQAVRQFAKDVLAMDLVMDTGSHSSVAQLVSACRTLLAQSALLADEKATAALQAWLRLELFLDEEPKLLRCLIQHRHALRLPAPSLKSLADDWFTDRQLDFFEALFEDLEGSQQRELLASVRMQERALRGSEKQGRWYRQACEERGLAPDTETLWAVCRNPVTTDLIASPCFALLCVEEQLAATTAWLQEKKDKAAQDGWHLLPSGENDEDKGNEERALYLWQRLARAQPEQLLQWLKAQDTSGLALVLFLYARHNNVDSLDALGRVLTEALQQGLVPDRRLLALPDISGRFLAHYLFEAPGRMALEMLLPYSRLWQLSVAGDGSGPVPETHPLHGKYLCPASQSGGRHVISFLLGAGTVDSRAVTRYLHGIVGEAGLLELALGAANRGEPHWWAWLLQSLQLYPSLAARIGADPRAAVVRVSIGHVDLALPELLQQLWQPFSPLCNADQQQGLLQALATPALQSGRESIEKVWALLEQSLIPCQPQVCRWLLQQVLTGEAPLWQQLYGHFFDGRSARFYELKSLLAASWCPIGQCGTAIAFDDWMTWRKAAPEYQQGSRDARAALTAEQYPALFSQRACGTYGRTVWFRTAEGVFRLKLHKKGEPLPDLLREQFALEFFADAQDRLALQGLRPEPLGCGWLPDFSRWLAQSGLDAATQRTLQGCVEVAEDGAVWGVVMRTPDEGYHHYAHERDPQGCPDAAREGIRLAARDTGTLLRHGLAATNLLPVYHQIPEQGDAYDGRGRAWQFMHEGDLGVINDWNGSATDHGNVARAPYGLRDWADVRALDSLAFDPSGGRHEQLWHSGAVRVNEAGKCLTGLMLLAARLFSADFDCTNESQVTANRGRLRSLLREVFGAFVEGLTEDRQAVASWRQGAEACGLLEAAARQIVFWCETGDAPSFEPHLRAGTLPCDIPRDYERIEVQSTPLRVSLHRKNTLMDHRHVYPLKQLTALIYLTLAHTIACADTGDRPADTEAGAEPMDDDQPCAPD